MELVKLSEAAHSRPVMHQAQPECHSPSWSMTTLKLIIYSLFKGAQAWDIRDWVIHTERSHLDRWHEDWTKKKHLRKVLGLYSLFCFFCDDWVGGKNYCPPDTTDLRIKIRIMLFSSVTLKMPIKNILFSNFFCLLLFEGTFTFYISLQRCLKKSQNSRNQGFVFLTIFARLWKAPDAYK